MKPRGFTRYFFVVALVLILSLIGGFAQSGGVPYKGEPAKVVLQLKWKHQFQFAGYYAALEKGYYRAAGLDVRLVEASENDSPVDKVLTGAADFGIAMSDLLVSKSRGAPVVVLAAIYQHSPLGILALKKSGVDSVSDLVGRRLMFEPESADLEAYLQARGVDIKDVSIIPYSSGVSALIDGTSDAVSGYWTDEPFALREQGLDYTFFSPREDGIDFYGDCLFTTKALAEAAPDMVEAFVKASLKGWEYAFEEPEEIIDLILAKYSRRHTREHLQYEADTSFMLVNPAEGRIGSMDVDHWMRIADIYKKLKMIPAEFTLDGFIFEPRRGG